MKASVVARLVGLALVLGTVPLAEAGYVGKVLADNPIAYWRFDDGLPGTTMATGTPAADTLGTHSGTYQNGVPLVVGAWRDSAAATSTGPSTT